MTPAQSLAALAVGVALLVSGLTVLFGGWALVGCGAVLVVVALLLPDRGQPTDEQVAEAVRKALGDG